MLNKLNYALNPLTAGVLSAILVWGFVAHFADYVAGGFGGFVAHGVIPLLIYMAVIFVLNLIRKACGFQTLFSRAAIGLIIVCACLAFLPYILLIVLYQTGMVAI